jgi:hypothetical protein
MDIELAWPTPVFYYDCLFLEGKKEKEKLNRSYFRPNSMDVVDPVMDL